MCQALYNYTFIQPLLRCSRPAGSPTRKPEGILNPKQIQHKRDASGYFAQGTKEGIGRNYSGMGISTKPRDLGVNQSNGLVDLYVLYAVGPSNEQGPKLN